MLMPGMQGMGWSESGPTNLTRPLPSLSCPQWPVQRALASAASVAGLPTYIVQDAGRTQVRGMLWDQPAGFGGL